MSIIANWDDVSPSTTGGGGAMTATTGVFGNGRTGTSQSWGFQRIPAIPITPSNSMSPYNVSALITVPNRGSSPQINIGGIGFFREGSSVDAAPFSCAVFDGRDSPTGTSAVLFQIRQGSLNTAGVVASSPSDTPVVPGRVYRVEHRIQPGTTGVLACSARFYDHTTNTLLRELTSNVSIGATTTVYPGYLTYGGAMIDSIQLQVSSEVYESNVPVKAYVGGSWVRKPMKKQTGGVMVPAYPKVRKNGQWVW